MRSLIYNNIRKSTFYFEINNLRLYFSSEFYKDLFISKLDYIDQEFYKLASRYKILDERFYETLNEILTISLYKRVEKRGFYIINLKDNSEIKG